MKHNLFDQPTVDGPLSYFQSFAFTNNIAVDQPIHKAFAGSEHYEYSILLCIARTKVHTQRSTWVAQ